MLAVGVHRVDGKVSALGDFRGLQAFGAQADDLDLARGEADVSDPPAPINQDSFHVGGHIRIDGFHPLCQISALFPDLFRGERGRRCGEGGNLVGQGVRRVPQILGEQLDDLPLGVADAFQFGVAPPDLADVTDALQDDGRCQQQGQHKQPGPEAAPLDLPFLLLHVRV